MARSLGRWAGWGTAAVGAVLAFALRGPADDPPGTTPPWLPPLQPPSLSSETGDSLPAPRVLDAGTPVLKGPDLPPAPRGCPAADKVLQGPIVSQGQAPPGLPSPAVQEGDQPLPINLPTALRLADARPLVIAAAQASLQVSIAQWRRARVLWIPDFNLGASYLGHDGGSAGNRGPEFTLGRDQLMLGGGVTAVFAVTDALFSPLAMRQMVRAREFEVQAARNDALQSVAEAYFNVQQARGRLAGMMDTQEKSRQLVQTIRKLATDLTSPAEINRAMTQLADLEREVSLAYQDWRVVSADLTRELRLNPLTVVTPLEPSSLQVTLISPREPVDGLVPIGLTNRPELAANQALVQATLVRLRQERLRPLIPSVVLAGNAVPVAPFGNLMFGAFDSDFTHGHNPWTGRFDPNVQVFWNLQNFGFGNVALVRERQADQQRALVELFRVQDRVAAEVVQAHSRVQSAVIRVNRSETEVQQALITFAANLKAVSETIRFGDRLILVNRPLEAVDSLRQVQRAYENYYTSVGDYNRAQFQLYRALGYPADLVACQPGDIQPVDTTRPPQMAPVQAPPPCERCPH